MLTLGQAHRFQNCADNMKASIQQMPTHPTVVWIRPLSRRLQCLFGWAMYVPQKRASPGHAQRVMQRD